MIDQPELLSLEGLRPFRPRARYNHGLDVLVYRAEGGLCIADRVDLFLTVLWSRNMDHLVGVRIKGVRYVFNQLRERHGWTNVPFLPLVSLLEAIAEDLGDEILRAASAHAEGTEAMAAAEASAQAADRSEKYALARGCVESVHLTKDQLRELVEV